MAEGDHIHGEFDASFDSFLRVVEEAKAALNENLAKAVALGDEALSAQVRSQVELTRAPSENVAAIEEANTALVRQNALKQLGRQLDLESLALLEQQARAYQQQLGLVTEFATPASRGPLVLPPERRGTSDPSRTAGGQAAEQEMVAALDREVALRDQALAQEQALIAIEERRAAIQREINAGYALGFQSVSQGQKLVAPQARQDLDARAVAEGWSAAERAQQQYNVSLGEYAAYSERADLSTQALQTQMTRLGVAEAESSNELRRHGALTTEFISALARGETTVSEFGYQLTSTIGKFGGWVTAAAATYGALGAVAEFGKGAFDAASGVQRLTRTIDGLDPTKANAAIQQLSQDTNVPIKEAANAVFVFSRTFHDLGDATEAARLGLSAFKLDNVSLTDSVKASTAIVQQFGGGTATLRNVYNELSAGQREYNARISEMIPLLQKAAGAVHNADPSSDALTNLIQLGTYAQRITQLGGSQVGTAFYRSAATFLNPSTTKGQTDRGVLESFGINTNQGWTSLIRDALIKSVTLTANDRAQISNAIFGPQYGGRLAAIFSPQGISTYQQIAGLSGDPRRAITPGATQGSLQTELSRELGTAGERLRSFINELQRLGAAIGASGIINDFSAFIGAFTTVGGAVRDIINEFAGLPDAIKQSVEALVLLRGAMLFLNRTRFGSSFGAVSRVARIPGLDPSYEDQAARATLTRGTRAAITQVEQEVSQTSATSLRVAATQATLARRRDAIEREIGDADQASQAQLDKRNAILAQIDRLERQGVAIETERNAQLEALAGLKQQYVGLTASRFSSRRYSEEQVAALSGAIGVGTNVAAEESQAAATTEETAAQGRLAAVRARLATLLRANAVATEEAAAATAAETAAVDSAVLAENESAGILAGASSRFSAFVGGLDPLTVALLGVPLVLGAVDSSLNQANAANDAARKAMDESTSNLAEFIHKQRDLAAAAQKQRNTQTHNDTPVIGGLISGAENTLDSLLGRNSNPSRANRATQVAGAYASTYSGLIAQARQDAQAVASGAESRSAWYEQLHRLDAEAQNFQRNRGGGALGTEALGDFYRSLQEVYQQEQTKVVGRLRGLSFIDQLSTLSDKNLANQVRAYADRADVYGLSGNDLQRAAQTYLFLAGKFRNSTDSSGLQEVQTAQRAFQRAVDRNVTDLLKAAESQTTYSGQSQDLSKAVTAIQQLHVNVDQWAKQMEDHFRKYPAIVRAIEEAARQIDSTLNDDLSNAITQQLQLVQTQSQLATSRIQGSSPEANISRAQSALSGLQDQLATARRDGAKYQVIAGLMAQINDAENALVQQQVANARSIVEAQGQLATSSITGIDPGSDIARARQDVSNAQQLLSFDQSHGAGRAAILQDQAAVDNAYHSMLQSVQQKNQQAHQDMVAYIQAQAALAASQTLDPVKKAQDQLAADIKILETISRSDYQTATQYLTALTQQRAAINDSRQKLNQAILSTDESTLQFELHTQRITDQQYINGLQKLLKMKQLSLQDRQRILTEIFDATHQAAVNLNVGSIQLPTSYEVRRAIAGAGRGRRIATDAAAVVQTNNNTANIRNYLQFNLARDTDMRKVADILHTALNTNVTGQMQAAGLI